MAARKKKATKKTGKRAAKKAIPPVPVQSFMQSDCPDDFGELCDALNDWAAEWEDWGRRVRRALNCVVDHCCPQCGPGGDPGPIPAPPRPPFR